MRLRPLLGPDQINPLPIALQLPVSSIVHVDARRAAQAGQRHHNPTHFLRRLTRRPTKYVRYKRQCVFARAAISLSQFERLLKETVRALAAIRPDLRGKAGFEPLLNALLERSNLCCHVLRDPLDPELQQLALRLANE